MRLALVGIAGVIAGWGCARGSAGAHQQPDSNGSGSGSNPSDAPPAVDARLPDASNGCATQPCDIPTQCGCGPTMACDINPMTQMGTACRMVTSPGIESSTCASATDCARGYVCVGDATNDKCERYCKQTSDCASPRGMCVIQLVNSMSQPIAGAVVCSSNCDPTAASNASCPASWTCDLFTAMYMNTSHSIVDCRKAGTATQGQTCSATVACAAGLTCITQGTAMSCAQICPRPQNTGCPTGKTCTSFQTAFVVGGQEYGVCI